MSENRYLYNKIYIFKMYHPCVVLRDIRFHIHPQGDKRLEYKKLNASLSGTEVV